MAFYFLVVRIPTSIETSIIISSFKLNPTNQGAHQIQLLIKYLGKLYFIYSTGRVYFAPFVPIIQSSGYGKSKVCFEILRECPGIPIVYRKVGATSIGYPSEKSWMKAFFQFVFNQNSDDDLPTVDLFLVNLAVNYTPGRFLVALGTLISAYIMWFNRLRLTMDISSAIKTIGNYFLSDKPTWGDEENQILVFNESDDRSIMNVVTSLKDQINDFVAVNGFTTLVDDRIGNTTPLNIPFIFVFDEITDIDKFLHDSTRISAVNIIRRGLHVLDTQTKLLALALGTNSDVVGFMPIVKNNSLRYITRFNLLPPIIISRNFDIYLEEARWPDLDLSQAILLNPKMLNLLVSMGRPLWSSYLISQVIRFANIKIKNGHDGHGDIADAFLATWLIRCSLNVNHSHLITRTLVNSHMATVYSVSSDGRSMKIKYPSEPILALGAREFLLKSELTIDMGRLRAFEHLLDFIRQRAVDKGRFTEVIFEQIVLFAMDDAPSATLLPPTEIVCDNQILKKIFNARLFVSEILKSDQPALTGTPDSAQTEHPQSQQATQMRSESRKRQLENTGEFGYHEPEDVIYKVIRLEDFVSTLYRIANALTRFFAPSLRNSLVNLSHFVTLSRDRKNVLGKWADEYLEEELKLKLKFQEEEDEDEDRKDELEEESENEDEDEMDQKQVFKLRRANTFTKECDVIDRSLLKIGLMRQCGYVMPVNYYAIDYIIPYALEDRTARNLYSFIPCQVKAGNTSIHDAIVKMAVQFHYCKCYDHEKCSVETCPGLTTDQELDLICQDQLAFLFCGGFEFPVRFGKEQVQYATKSLSDEWNTAALTRINELFGREQQPVHVLKIAYPSFSQSVSLRDSGNSPDIIILKRLSSSVAVEIMRWVNGGGRPDYVLTCVISARLSSFTHLIGRSSIDVAYNIINYDSVVFDDIDDIHLPLTMDAIINSSFADFPDVDRQMTMARGRTPPFTDLPGSLRYCNNINLQKSINKSISRNPN